MRNSVSLFLVRVSTCSKLGKEEIYHVSFFYIILFEVNYALNIFSCQKNSNHHTAITFGNVLTEIKKLTHAYSI